MARSSKQQEKTSSETGKLFGDSFIPVGAIPSVRVTRNEPAAVPSQLQADEEEEMMRRVLRYLDDPQKDDPGSCPINSWKTIDQSLEAQVTQVIAGNLDLPAPGAGNDNILADIINTTCLWIPPPLLPRVTDSTPLQAHSYLSMRSSILHSGSHSQTRGQSGTHIKARRFVPPVRPQTKPGLLIRIHKDVSA